MTGPVMLGRPIARRTQFNDYGGVVPEPAAGSQYGSPGSVSAFIPAEGSEHSVPVVLPAGTIATIGCRVTVAGSAGALVRLGIRIGNDTNTARRGLPGANSVILDAGTVAADSTGVKTIAVNTQITVPGRYWLSLVVQGGATTRPTVATRTPTGQWMTEQDDSNNSPLSYRFNYSVTGALPATPANYDATGGVNHPLVFVRYA